MANMRLGRLSTHANDIDSCEHFTHPKCDKVYRLCWRLSCRKRFFTAEIMCSDTMSLWYTFPDDCPTINFRLTIWRWTVITTKIVQSFFRGVTVTMKIFRFCFIEVLNSLIFFLLQNVMVFKFEIYSNTFLPHKTQQSWHSCITCSDWDHSFCYADEVIRDFTLSLAAAVKCAQLLGLQCLSRQSSTVFWFEKKKHSMEIEILSNTLKITQYSSTSHSLLHANGSMTVHFRRDKCSSSLIRSMRYPLSTM